MKTASGALVVMVSQSLVACFPSECALISMQLISPEGLASALLAGVCDVAWLMRVASVVSSVVQVKWQFRQENGPLVVLEEA